MLTLIQTKRTDKRLLDKMKIHYSQPRGFVGRNICYAVMFNDIYFGHIVAGSATLHLPGRHDFLGTSKSQLNNIVNNIFFNVSPQPNSKYPVRNFTVKVIKVFVQYVVSDWNLKYGDEVLGLETLVEAPRTGELYLRAGWKKVGVTKGFTCKRIAGKSTDSWSGKRVWKKDPASLRPKNVLCYKIIN